MRDWAAFVRQTLAADGTSPMLHREAIDELAAHLGDVYRSAIAAGADPAVAEAAAKAELAGMGPLARALDRRAHRAFAGAHAPRRFWRGVAGDIRQAARLIWQRPAVSLLAVLTLALGIGVATTVFGIYNAVVLGSLPYPDASRLVLLWEAEKTTPADPNIVAAPVYEDWRARQRTLESLGLWEFVSFNVRAAAEPEHIGGIRASASLFDTLGVAPAIGRTFTADEDLRGARVAVISDAVWRAHFAADPNVVGRQVRLNDAAYDVVGVMPAAFTFPRRTTGIYVPLSLTALDRERDSHSFYAVGRRRPDVSFAQVRDDFARIGDELARTNPANADETSVATPLDAFGLTMITRMLAALGGASALVLVIACVNVANLLIARAIDRRREFGIRRALGAGSGRLARQLLIEGLALAALGAAGGVLVAFIGTQVLDAVLGQDFLTLWFRGHVTVHIDGVTLVFTIAAAVVTALLFSFAPLVGLRRPALSSSLRESGRGVARSAFGVRRVLIAGEVALAIVVLCGAGLLVKSFFTLLRVNPGLDPDRVLTLEVSLPQADTYGPAVRASFCDDITAAAAGGPFSGIGAISHLPLAGANATRGLSIDGRPLDPKNPVNANYRLICPGYFHALGIPFVRGRDVATTDAEPVVVINRAMADRYWKDQDPVGQRIRIGRTDGPPWMRIVGVAENTRHFGLESEPIREIFVPYRQNAWPLMTIVAKTAGGITPSSVTALRDVVHRVDPGLPATAVRAMSQIVDDSVRWRASFLRLLLVFAVLGLALSGVGVYGVLAYFVSQRSHELGIRVALGAARPSIVRLVLRQTLVPIAAGIVIGAIASLWTGRLLTDWLFHTQPGDPAVMATIVVIVFGTGVAASWIPAHRAAGVDATVVLRRD